MDLGWLPATTTETIFVVAQWLRRQPPLALIAVTIAVLLSLQIMRSRRRRRGASRWPGSTAAQARENREALKEQLRRRLAEPSTVPHAGPVLGAPTVGARRAFEADIDAAAGGVLLEAGGRRGKAKQLLRTRAEGNGAGDGKLNGSEAGFWRQLGALSLIDSTRDALAAYSRAADLAPDDPEVQMLLGVLSLRAGKLDAAEAAFRRQVRLGQRLGTGSGGGTARYRGSTMLGDVHAARGALEEALAAYQEAQREVLALLELDDGNAALQRDLSLTCDRIGDTHLAKGQLQGALESFRSGLEIAEVLAARDPDHAGWQHDLSVSLDRVGEVLERMGDQDGAFDSFRKGLAIAERLAAREPGRPDWQWDLSQSLDRLGDALMVRGKAEEALDHFRRGLAVAETAAAGAPDNLQWQRDLAAGYHKLGSIELDRLNAGEARELLERGRAIIARLERIAAYQAQWRSDLSRFDEALRALGT